MILDCDLALSNSVYKFRFAEYSIQHYGREAIAIKPCRPYFNDYKGQNDPAESWVRLYGYQAPQSGYLLVNSLYLMARFSLPRSTFHPTLSKPDRTKPGDEWIAQWIRY